MKPRIRPYVHPHRVCFPPSGYWQVKLERSYTRVSRFSCHPSAVKSAGSTAAGHVARLLSADDNLPSAFLSAGHEQAGRRAGLIAASGRPVTLVRSQPARRVVACDRWHGATYQTRLGHDARPAAITFRPPNGHSSDLCTRRSRSSRPSGGSRGALARPATRQTHGTNEIAEANGTPVPGLVTQRPVRPAVCHRSDEDARCAHAERPA
jgi:hypothetical protein